MSIQHHPDDATLMAFAAGTLTEPFAVVVSAHLEMCGQCRKTSRTMNDLGAAMMQKADAMKQHMADMNAKLQTLVDDMNKSRGSAKVDKMQAVINELVSQRSMMQKEMMDMQPQMMHHMMEHMQSGMMKGMADSMAGCPMMKHMTPPAAPEPK